MAVAIRLTRVGATKRPAYRVIAIDKRRSRDGRALEILGFYDPLTEPATVQLNGDRIKDWIGKGAQPSETVVKLMRQAEAVASDAVAEKPKRPTRSPKPSKKAQAKAASAAAAPKDVPAPEAPTAEAGAGEVPVDEAVAEAAPATEAVTEAVGAAEAATDEPADAEQADA